MKEFVDRAGEGVVDSLEEMVEDQALVRDAKIKGHEMEKERVERNDARVERRSITKNVSSRKSTTMSEKKQRGYFCVKCSQVQE